MKKLAIFVEGLTEQILVRHLLQSVLDQRRIAIETVKITGGHNVRMSFTVMRAAHTERQTDYYIMIYDCGGETNVKGYLMAHRDKLVSSGYSMVIGLRDVYPNFQRDEIPKLIRGLNFKLPQKRAFTHIYLAVMETEAWFLGEYRHLKKVSARLSPEYIQKRLGFNPRTENMEDRDRPAADMKAAYHWWDMIIPRKGTVLTPWSISWIFITSPMSWRTKCPAWGILSMAWSGFSRKICKYVFEC